MTHPKTYPYGFCLLPQGTGAPLPDTYATEAFGEDYEFSHDTRREVLRATTDDGGTVVVFGRCYVLADDPAAASPGHAAAFLAAGLDESEAQFLDRLDLLAGRWIALVTRGREIALYHDAIGSRSVYFDAEHGAAASHAALLGEIYDRGPSNVLKPSMTWDLSNVQGVRALLPNHRLDVRTGDFARYWPRVTNPWIRRSEDDRLQRVIALWHRQMDQVMASGLPVHFALSGGLDSRVALALSTPYMDRIQTYTYGASATAKESSVEVLNRDLTLVQPLADLLNLDHRVIQGGAGGRKLTDDESEALSRNSLTVHGRWLIPHYQKNFSAPDGLVLRANAFEVGQHKWASASDDDVARAAKSLWIKRANSSGVEIPGESLRTHIDRSFAEQQLDTDLHGYLASDLTHWEFRLGRWAAEAFNEIDLAFEPLVPLGCRAILTPLLAFDRVQRESQYAFRELINAAYPVLNFHGINDTANLYEAWRDFTPTGAGLPEKPSRQIQTGHTHVLPLTKFAHQQSETVQVFATPLEGRLSFDVETFWSNASGDQSFEYRIIVDNEPVLSFAGTSPAGRSSIVVDHLRAGSVVDLAIVPLRPRTQPSWERATRIRFDEIRFEAVAPQGEAGATIVHGSAAS